jgi:hypothetical protein
MHDLGIGFGFGIGHDMKLESLCDFSFTRRIEEQ